jgi:ectoine hydroxylase-related dioxygenase (phytanoyl-CoA dioxygenase family)
MYKMLPGEEVPDVEAMRAELPVVHWDMSAGDCLVHHCMTMHGSPGNSTNDRRRRAYATRWTGDDVVFAPRDGQVAITVNPPTVRPGEPLDSEVFPRLWPR